MRIFASWANLIYLLVGSLSGAEIIRGVRASSTKIESTSSTIA